MAETEKKKQKTEKRKLYLVTGNKNKLKEIREILGDSVDLEAISLDLPELQGEPDEIAAEKCRMAVKQAPGPVITDDTSLCFNALNGLPELGPYIKWFLTKLGHSGLLKMLSGFGDYSGYALCTFAFSSGPGKEPIICKGRCDGTIVPPRGSLEFGWDPIFQPEGYDQTYAEMDSKTKNRISHRGLALNALKEMLLVDE